MAQGKSIGKFTTYSALERGRVDRQPRPDDRRGSGTLVVDEDDEDQFDIPARFSQKWSK